MIFSFFIIIKISTLKAEIIDLKSKKELYEKENKEYSSLANKAYNKNEWDLMNRYKEKAQNALGSYIAAKMAISVKESELNDFYLLMPELKD